MKIYFVRHGETDWNKQGIIQGRTDIPLNETGMAQALETKNKLISENFDCIYCSPLIRARQTAEIINQERSLPIRYDERLIERDFGSYEGTEVKKLNFKEFWNLDNDHPSHGEESARSFFNRIHNFIHDIIRLDYSQILIVAHGGVSLPVYSYFHDLKEDNDYVRYMLKNCEVACYDTNRKYNCEISKG